MELSVDKENLFKSGVYKITSDSSPNKIYIGSAVVLKFRFYNHRSELRRGVHRNIHLQRQFNKYDDLKFELISLCPKEKLLELEQLILDEYTELKEVFNVCKTTKGGRLGIKHTDESKRKMSQSLKGRVGPRLGVKYDDELRAKLSKAHKGLKSPLKGRKRPQKDSIALKKAWAEMPFDKRQEWIRRNSEAQKKNWAINKVKLIANRISKKVSCKWIAQCDLNGNELSVFHGIKYAAKDLGIQPQGISNCIKGRLKSYKGFLWKYSNK